MKKEQFVEWLKELKLVYTSNFSIWEMRQEGQEFRTMLKLHNVFHLFQKQNQRIKTDAESQVASWIWQ